MLGVTRYGNRNNNTTSERCESMSPAKEKAQTEDGEKSSRPTPDYGVTALDELPGKPPTVRQQVYDDLLREVARDHPDKWCKIATFHSDEGGSQKKRSIEKGESPVPGPLDDWSFESRRGPIPEIGLAKGESALFAKYTGSGLPEVEPENAEAEAS